LGAEHSIFGPCTGLFDVDEIVTQRLRATRKRFATHFAASVCTVLIVVSLAGCDLGNRNSGPASASVVDGGIQIAICTAVTFDTMTAGVVEKGSSNWSDLWSASGGGTIKAGDILTSENLPDHFEQIALDKVPDPDISRFSIAFLAEDGLGVSAGFDFEANPPVTGKWVHPDGRYSSTACNN
jgi:hypothetical protein